MFRGLGGIHADDVGGRVPAAILEIMSGYKICKSIASDPDSMCSAGESGVGATVSRANTYGRTHALFEDVHTTLNSHELFEDVLYAKLSSLSLCAKGGVQTPPDMTEGWSPPFRVMRPGLAPPRGFTGLVATG